MHWRLQKFLKLRFSSDIRCEIEQFELLTFLHMAIGLEHYAWYDDLSLNVTYYFYITLVLGLTMWKMGLHCFGAHILTLTLWRLCFGADVLFISTFWHSYVLAPRQFGAEKFWWKIIVITAKKLVSLSFGTKYTAYDKICIFLH